MKRRSPKPFRPTKIVSGGQTGVDRGALDAAIAMGVPHGGWCPLGRLAEDAPIPSCYLLQENASQHYAVRTEQNVIDSDATLILHLGPLRGGTALTRRLAREYQKPCLTIDLAGQGRLEATRVWLEEVRPNTLNVAGPRESQRPGIGSLARTFLEAIFSV